MANDVILVVDYEPMRREKTSELLVQNDCAAEGTDTADSAHTLLWADGTRYSLLLITTNLPGSLGAQDLAGEVRERKPDFPVVFTDDAETSPQLPGAPVLRKNFTLGQLLNAVETALR